MRKWRGLFLLVMLVAGLLGLTARAEDVTDLSKAVRVETTEQAILVLKEARANHQEEIILYLNPSKVPIENEKEGWADVHFSIYNAFHYGYSGGLYNAMDYDVFSGPSLDSIYLKNPETGRFESFDSYQDLKNPAYYYYRVVFQYHDNKEELAKADAKIKAVLSEVSGKSDGEKVLHFVEYMRKHVPKEKLSDNGYPRNCNGIYGALFGDGTGYACHTYASTIQRFAELAGIPGHIVGGAYEKGEPNHAFNVVKVSGKWYVVDYTILLNDADIDEILMGEETYGLYSMHDILVKRYLSSYPMALKDYGKKADAKPPVTKPTTAKPEKVTLTSAKSAGYRYITLKWKRAKNAKGYEIYYSARKSGGYKKLKTIKGGRTVSYKATGLTTGKRYYFKVRAYSGSKKGSFSKILSAAPTLGRSSLTKAENISKRRVSLSWKKVSGASGYEVYYKSGKGSYKRLKTLSKTKYTPTKRFTRGKKYTFKVRAYRRVNKKKVYGAFSGQKSIIIKK